MADKLIDGNITIKDAASKGLSLIEKKLLSIRKSSKATVADIERLKEEFRASKWEWQFKWRHKPKWEKNSIAEFPVKNYEYGRVNKAYPNVANLRYRGNFTSASYGNPEWNWAKYKVRPNRIRLSDRAFVQSPTNWAETNSRIALADRLPATRGRLSLNSRNLGISVPGLSTRRSSITPLETHPDGMINTKANFSTSGLDSRRLALSFSDVVMRLNKGNFGRMSLEGYPDGMIDTRSKFSAYSLNARRLGVSALDMAGRKSASQKSIVEATKTVTESAKKVEKELLKVPETIKNSLNKKGGIGLFGKLKGGLGGALEGRLSSAMFSGSGLAGSVLGGFSKGGPLGAIIGLASEGIIAVLEKIGTHIQDVIDAVNRIAEERARESIGLRRKMQMSSGMFGVNPTDIKQIDKKIYAMREMEQQMYLHNLPGRDVTSSSIEWLHLLGTKDSGGVFEDEKEAFKFSKSLAAIAKMNDLSPQEYETVRYQGMQILSKGYADILDIKPLLNSAPGFVRDILQQTGMTRKDLLESGRSRGFTADMFKQALLNVGDYYETLASRATSRTPEDQEAYAEQIVGRAAIYDEMYEKEKAMQNTKIMTAVAEANMLEGMKESWYKMWSDTNDAQDGIVKKVEFEKKITLMVLKGLNGVIFGATIVKNVFDMVFDTLRLVGEEVFSIINLVPSALNGAFGSFFAWVYRKIGELPTFDKEHWNAMADEIDPNSKKKLNDAYLESRADEINKYISALDPNTDLATLTGELIKMGLGEEKVVGYEDKTVVPKMLEQRVWDDNLLGGGRGGWREALPGENSLKRQQVWVEHPELAYTEKVPIKQNVLPEWFTKEFFFGGGNADEKSNRIADESFRKNVLLQHPELWAQMKDGIWQDKEAFKDLAGETRSLSAVLGGVAESGKDYTWGNRLLKSVTDPFLGWAKRMGQNADDIKKGRERYDKTLKEINDAAQDVHSGDLPKIAGDVKNISKGKGTEKVLDVLKEIAGVTVINKVTQVRPDVVFNYGSYGRNSGNEDRNLVRVGDPNFLASAVQALNSVAAKWDDNFQSIANGVPSEVSIA